jgi:hypothetical protein
LFLFFFYGALNRSWNMASPITFLQTSLFLAAFFFRSILAVRLWGHEDRPPLLWSAHCNLFRHKNVKSARQSYISQISPSPVWVRIFFCFRRREVNRIDSFLRGRTCFPII